MSNKPHPAVIEFLERIGELIKGLGVALTKLAYRLKTEPTDDEEQKGH